MSVNESSEFEEEEVVPLKIVIISIYAALCTGIILNVIVIGMIVHIFRTLNDGLSDKRMFLYILSLSCVDLLVLANLPLIIVDIVMNGEWIFGDLLCKIHWTTDSVNKILSTFILTLVSFDRYLSICQPYRFRWWKNIKTTIVSLFVCTILSICLLSPCYLHAGVRKITYPQMNITFLKCSYSWTEANDTMFVNSLFIIGYCIPFLLMTFFHTNILKTLKRNGQRIQRRIRRRTSTIIHNVGCRMLFVIIFYFVCWTPYWLQTYFIQYVFSQTQDESNWRPTLFLIVHFLVYSNSAANPLIYGICNLEIRRQQVKAIRTSKRRQSSLSLQKQQSSISLRNRASVSWYHQCQV